MPLCPEFCNSELSVELLIRFVSKICFDRGLKIYIKRGLNDWDNSNNVNHYSVENYRYNIVSDDSENNERRKS